jgi:hypothetical protein
VYANAGMCVGHALSLQYKLTKLSVYLPTCTKQELSVRAVDR